MILQPSLREGLQPLGGLKAARSCQGLDPGYDILDARCLHLLPRTYSSVATVRRTLGFSFRKGPPFTSASQPRPAVPAAERRVCPSSKRPLSAASPCWAAPGAGPSPPIPESISRRFLSCHDDPISLIRQAMPLRGERGCSAPSTDLYLGALALGAELDGAKGHQEGRLATRLWACDTTVRPLPLLDALCTRADGSRAGQGAARRGKLTGRTPQRTVWLRAVRYHRRPGDRRRDR